MNISSIENIGRFIPRLSTALQHYMQSNENENHELKVYGIENEYSIDDIIALINSIIMDLKIIMNNPQRLIHLTTSEERKELVLKIRMLIGSLNINAHIDIVNAIDELKVITRIFNIQYDNDKIGELENIIDRFKRLSIKIEEDSLLIKHKYSEANSILDHINELNESCEKNNREIKTRRRDFITQFEELSQNVNKAKELSQKANKSATDIYEINSKVESIQQKVDELNFSIEKQDTDMLEKNKQYKEYLQGYKELYEQNMNEVNTLIQQAKVALQYTTAEGISAAFQEQYNDAKKGYKRYCWLGSALMFIVLTIVMGCWVISVKDTELYLWIGRISMLPLLITAAAFSTRQYIKQKNIIEDYGYKTVLSKSLIAFSEELRKNNPEEYSEYLALTLKEIHKDPLRKRNKEDDDISLKDSLGIFGKLTDTVKNNIDKFSK